MDSRKGQFATGATSGPSEPASLKERAARFNSLDPKRFQPNGLNQQIMLSANNGNSAADAYRQTPNGQLPSSNGMSKSTYDKLTPQYGMKLDL